MAEETLLEFPCDFPIKVMGRMEPGFAQDVVAIVKRHAPEFDETSLQMRPSSKKSLTPCIANYVTTRPW